MKHVLTIVLGLALSVQSGCGRIRDTSDRWFGGDRNVAAEKAGEDRAGEEMVEAQITETGSAGEDPAHADRSDRASTQEAGWSGARPTIASLGDPARPGLWMETPLVSREQPGRVVVRASGASVNLTLIPSGGVAAGSGRLSLQAMQALGAPLTELVPVDVYSG